MSTQLKLRRGTTAQHSTFTGASGEVTVDTTKKTLVVHDGTTAGGVPLQKEAFQQSGTGSTIRTVDAKLKDFVSAADFGMSTSNSGAANKTALTAAMTASRVVYIPAGTYNIDGDILVRRISQVIMGAASSSAYNQPASATKLVFTSGTVGFDLTTTFQQVGDSENSVLQDLWLDGNGVVQTVVKFAGTKFFYRLHLERFTTNGFWGTDNVNSTVIDNCSVFNYDSRGAAWGNASRFTGFGLLMEGAGTTCFFVSNSRFRCCQYGMVLRASQGSTFSNNVFESNSAIGLLMEASDGKGMARNLFQSCWLENNSEYSGSGTYYQMSITNYATSSTWYARNNEFVNCNFSVPATAYQRAISIADNVFDTKFYNSSFGGNDGNSIMVGGTSANGTEFIHCRGVTETNYGLSSWNNFNVKAIGGSMLKRTAAGRDIFSIGDSPNTTFTMANNTTMSITTNAGGAMAALVSLFSGDSGHGGLFFLTGYVFTQLSDTANIYEATSTPAAGQIGIWADTAGKIYIKNNAGATRNLTVNIIGARILSVTDPA